MKVTTQTIIKSLPFDQRFKEQLLEKLDKLDPIRKFQATKILWDAYYGLYDAQLDQNLDEAFERAGQDEEKLDREFFKRAVDKAQQDMEEAMTQTTEQADLSSTREKLEELMKKPANN